MGTVGAAISSVIASSPKAKTMKKFFQKTINNNNKIFTFNPFIIIERKTIYNGICVILEKFSVQY